MICCVKGLIVLIEALKGLRCPVNASKNKILVTGGAGFIATHLARRLLDEGYSVRSLDLRDPRNPVEGVEYIRGDVREEDDLRKAVRDVSAVYHFAAIVNVTECQERPLDSYATNFMGTVKVLEAVREEGIRSGQVPRIIFAGSSAVYGLSGREGVPIRETDVASQPLSFYAHQKQASEDVIRLYRQHRGVPSVIFRFFNVYGVGQDPTSPYSGVITIFSRLAREGSDLQLHGGGSQTRDFISVSDLTRACASALKLDQSLCDGQAINLGTGAIVTIAQLGEIILRVAQGRGRLVTVPARPGDVPHSMADVKRAKEILNWNTQIQLEAGLKELL
jgi:UDP-glucose 4-epimerase